MTNPDPQTFLTAKLYSNENRRQIPGWSLHDLALLKSIKSNTTRLWDMRCPDRKDQFGGVENKPYMMKAAKPNK
jgi:hypothetical protein